MKAQTASDVSVTSEASSRAGHCQRTATVAVLVALVCSGATSCSRTQIALSGAAIAAVVVGTTVGITYAVKHSHHTLQGCVSSDDNGLKLRTSDAKIYTLKGDAASIKVGDSVKLHGSKVKKAKGDSTGDQVFVVQKVSKDNGPCAVNVPPSPTTSR